MATTHLELYPGESLCFTQTLTISGAAQDITGDTVMFRAKRQTTNTNAEAVLTKAAEVTTQGASGVAIYDFSHDDTKNLAIGEYVWDIVWNPAGGGEYVFPKIAVGTMTVKTRSSDAS